MDVVVVGGGIVGLSAAHAAAECGADVTLLEKGSLGGGSTARAAGGIRSQFSTRVNVELSLASKAVWDDFADAFGVDIGLRKNGYLLLARSEITADRFRESVGIQRACGAETEYLTPAEAADRCPGVDPGSFVAATYNADDGIADPNLAVQGYAAAARDLGVDIRTGVAVTDILRDGDRVVGVEAQRDAGTERGEASTERREADAGAVRHEADAGVVRHEADAGVVRHEADVVVNAAGAWASRVGELAGVDLPIVPRRRQIAIVEPSSPIPESSPLTIDIDTGSYFRPEGDEVALVGGHFAEGPVAERSVDPDAFDEGMDIDWAATAVERAADYAAYFGPETRIRRGWAGLYAVTPDHHPIIEESRPGLVTAAGFSGHGFQHAPATGRIVADLLFDGRSSLVDVSGLDRGRFDRGESLTERNVA